jgi:hypothetical protein
MYRGLSLGRAEFAHVFEGNDDLQVELLRDTGVDELDRPRTRDEAADLRQRTLCRRQPDPLERLLDEPLQPFDGKREVCPALRARNRVHLVED